jgi:MATE family multidrug resistance protein
MGAQLAQTAMGFVDTVMAGNVSPQDLAAVAVGFSIWVPLMLFLNGILLAITPLTARYHGAGEHKPITAIVQQGLWLALGLGALGWFILQQAHLTFPFMQVEPEIAIIATGYLEGIAWALPAAAIYQVFRSFNEGLGNTRVALMIGIVALLINIPANYVFIYGGFGIEPMGAVGCGWATALVSWFMAISIALYSVFHPHFKQYHLAKVTTPKVSYWRDILRLGVPMGLAIFVEVTLFCIIALLIARLGATTLAAHQIALNITSLIFMLPLSLSIAMTIRVGHLLGANKPDEAQFSSIVGISIGLIIAFLCATMIYLGSNTITHLYTQDIAVQTLASSLLVFAAIYQFSDAIQVGAAGALRGYKDTLIPLILTLISFWFIGLGVGYTLGLTDLWGAPMGPKGFWIGMVAGLTCASVLMIWRLRLISNAQTLKARQ